MFNKIILTITIGVILSGCFMAPMAFIGPVSSGFSTASIIQSGVSSGASYIVKKNTGKTISEHAIGAINKETTQQSYFPTKNIK